MGRASAFIPLQRRSPTTVTCHSRLHWLQRHGWMHPPTKLTVFLSGLCSSLSKHLQVEKKLSCFFLHGNPSPPLVKHYLWPSPPSVQWGMGVLAFTALLLAFLMPSSLLHLAAQCPDKSTDPACEAAVTPNLQESPGTPCSLHPHSHVHPRVVPGLRSPVCHDSCSG